MPPRKKGRKEVKEQEGRKGRKKKTIFVGGGRVRQSHLICEFHGGEKRNKVISNQYKWKRDEKSRMKREMGRGKKIERYIL